MNGIDIKRIQQEVKANVARLEACTGPHQFETIDDRFLREKHRCKLCGGVVDNRGRYWYDRGLAHGRKP